MYRIRFHGRGGEGMKTASRILGTSLFLKGLEVQDAPRYGAERRGAPVFAYVRASRYKINERGVISKPDLIVIADESLLRVTPEILLEGVTLNTVILVISEKSRNDLNVPEQHRDKVITLALKKILGSYHLYLSSICASAAARLLGVISMQELEQSISDELSDLAPEHISKNIKTAGFVFREMKSYSGIVNESEDISCEEPVDPVWTTLTLKQASRSTPSIRQTGTTINNKTGLWRTMRPVINRELCSRCMLCCIYCPESVITPDSESNPVIDYEHCKGCLICSEVCPLHAIEKVDENTQFTAGEE